MASRDLSDRCPYPRPFPAGFDRCGTYQAQLFIPLTSDNRLLPAVRSCVFLTVAEREGGHYYPRCELGTEEDRARWLGQRDSELLELLKRFRQGLSVTVRESAERMWQLKGRQLAAREGSDLELERQVTDELAAAAADFQRVVDDFLPTQSEVLARLNAEPDEVRELIRALLDDMVMSRSASAGPIPVSPRVLGRFTPAARALFSPYEAAARVSSGELR